MADASDERGLSDSEPSQKKLKMSESALLLKSFGRYATEQEKHECSLVKGQTAKAEFRNQWQ
eukprot:6127830-Pyramimonas_sp.AAC.1